MCFQGLAQYLLGLFEKTGSPDELSQAMAEASRALGYRHFALAHHVDHDAVGSAGIRLHNYPERWARFYDDHGFGGTDPVHRASQVTGVGFSWARIPEMIALSKADRELLALGRAEGIEKGFTIPAHIPGDAQGSVSFAGPIDEERDASALLCAQLVGSFAFEAARRLHLPGRGDSQSRRPVLTDRQRDCLLWVARGKTDWEIGRILGRSEETVARHIKQACERYGVSKRTLLVTLALKDGTLTFPEIRSR